MEKIVTIGSATQDIFIESDLGKILTMRDAFSESSFLCFEYGAKIEIDQLAFDVGGGAINTAVNFANLGFNVSPIVKIGNDLNAEAVMRRVRELKMDESLILKSDEYKTGFSVILTSFEGDRTVMAHRGANSKIFLDDLNWDEIKKADWVYIAPLSGDSNSVLDELADFAEKNGINMAFNPGTTQIKRGIEDLKRVLSTAEVLVMNTSEAAKITGIPLGVLADEDTKVDSAQKIKEMFFKLKSYGPKVVVITEGGKGVHAFDGEACYFAPPFPSNVVSTLGAGDAFSSTFVASLIKFNWNIEKALTYASVNAASVVQSFGAQTGLKNFEHIAQTIEQNGDFAITKKIKSSH